MPACVGGHRDKENIQLANRNLAHSFYRWSAWCRDGDGAAAGTCRVCQLPWEGHREQGLASMVSGSLRLHAEWVLAHRVPKQARRSSRCGSSLRRAGTGCSCRCTRAPRMRQSRSTSSTPPRSTPRWGRGAGAPALRCPLASLPLRSTRMNLPVVSLKPHAPTCHQLSLDVSDTQSPCTQIGRLWTGQTGRMCRTPQPAASRIC